MKRLGKETTPVVVRTKRIIEGVECDVCKRLIVPTKYAENSSQYFEIITGHNDWGNDSCDSREYFDVCPNCIGDFVAKYARESSGTNYLEMSNEYVIENTYEYD